MKKLFFVILAAFISSAAAAQTADLLPDINTRQRLTLQQFQKFALTGNPTLAEAKALIDRSAAQAKQVSLWPNPSIGYQGEQIRGGDYGGGEQGVFVQQTFVLGGKLDLRKNIYRQQRREDDIGAEEQRHRVLSDTGQMFYTALAAQEVVALRRQLLAIASDAVETAHQLRNIGQADAPDVLQSEIEAEQAKADYTTAQRLYIRAFRNLSALVNRPDLPLSPLSGNLAQWPAIDATHIVDQILHDSPTIKRAGQEVERAQAERKAARRESVPDLVLRAGVEQNYEHLSPSTNRAVGAQGFATAGIVLPIFNRNQGNVAAASAEIERAQANVLRTRLSVRSAAQSLLERYLADRAQAGHYRDEMIPRAERAYQLYLVKYRNMAAAYPQVLISQRTLFQVRVAYIDVLKNLWLEATALENYTLSDGLAAPIASGPASTALNLPTSGSAGVP